MQAFVVSLLLLSLLVGLGVGAIVTIRKWAKDGSLSLRPDAGRGDWESWLAKYKNLRDKGVLSDEEYRKIRTLVEPSTQADSIGGLIRGRPQVGPDNDTATNRTRN